MIGRESLTATKWLQGTANSVHSKPKMSTNSDTSQFSSVPIQEHTQTTGSLLQEQAKQFTVKLHPSIQNAQNQNVNLFVLFVFIVA